MAYDFKREFRDLYQPKAHPSLSEHRQHASPQRAIPSSLFMAHPP